MVRLDLDLPLPLPLEQLVVRPRYTDLVTVLERCEFKGLLEEIRLEAGKLAPAAQLTQGDLF
jgi:DNA polymerase-1